MSAATNVVRMNLSLPTSLVQELKRTMPNRGISKFIAQAAEDKMKALRKERALKELLAAPPAFTEIKNSVAYIRRMRRVDEKRMKRLGI